MEKGGENIIERILAPLHSVGRGWGGDKKAHIILWRNGLQMQALSQYEINYWHFSGEGIRI
jgi:hypothetical protein